MIPFGLPKESEFLSIFRPGGGPNYWHPYQIHPGARLLQIIAIGGGGPGGNGFPRADASAGG